MAGRLGGTEFLSGSGYTPEALLKSGSAGCPIEVVVHAKSRINELEPIWARVEVRNSGGERVEITPLRDGQLDPFHLTFSLRALTKGARGWWHEELIDATAVGRAVLAPGDRMIGEYLISGPGSIRGHGEFELRATVYCRTATRTLLVESLPTRFTATAATDDDFYVCQKANMRSGGRPEYFLSMGGRRPIEFEEFLESHPSHFLAPYLAHSLAAFYASQGVHSLAVELAREYWDRGGAGFPLSDDLLMIWAEGERAMGNGGKAKELLRKVAAEYAETESAGRARAELERIGGEGESDAGMEEIGAATTDRLVALLRSERAYERWQAAKILGERMERQAVAALRVCVFDEDVNVRTWAALAFGKVGDHGATEALITALQDRHRVVRWRAARSLGELEDERAVPGLTDFLIAGDEADKWAAAGSLGRIGGVGVEALLRALEGCRDGDRTEDARWLKLAVAYGLGESRDTRGIGPLKRLAVEEPTDGEPSRSLGQIGRAAVEALIAILKESKWDGAVSEAARALGVIGDPRAVEPLIAVAGGKGAGGKSEAARALRRMRTASVGPLIGTLGDDDEGMRVGARSVLASIGSPAVDELARALGAGDSMTREGAASVLGEIGDRTAVEPLIVALQDEEPGVRRSAAEALGKIGDRRAVGPLIGVLDDQHAWVRQHVIEAIARLQDPRAIDALVKAAKKDQSAVTALGRMGRPAVDPLLAILRGNDLYDRGSAAIALGEIGDTRAVGDLISVLGENLPEHGRTPQSWERTHYGRLCEHAALALGMIGDQRAVEPLAVVLRDSESQAQRRAGEALVRIGGELAMNALRSALRSDDARIVRIVVGALGQGGHEWAIAPLIELHAHSDEATRRDIEDALRKLGRYGIGRQ